MVDSTAVTIPAGADVMKFVSDLMNQVATLKLQATGMALSHDEAMAQIGNQSAGIAAQLQASLASTAQQAQAASQQYDVELKQYGLSVADLNFRQRVGALQAQLQTVAQGVDVVRQRTETGLANYQQRIGQFGARATVAQMLADRSGPQDFYAYEKLKNQLSADTPGGGVTTIDPYKWTEDLVQPISDALPEWAAKVKPDPSGINQPYKADTSRVSAGAGGAPGGGGAAVGAGYQPSAAGTLASKYLESVLTPGQGGATAPAAPAGETGFAIDKVKPGWNLITLGPGGDVNRDQFDPSITAVYGQDAFDPATGSIRPGATQSTVGKAGGAYWVNRAAGGGEFKKKPVQSKGKVKQAPSGRIREAKATPKDAIGPVVVGDTPSGAPSGTEELAMVKNPGPDTTLAIQPANGPGMEMQQDQAGGDPRAAVQQALEALNAAIGQMLENPAGEPAPPPQEDLLGMAGMAGPMPRAAGGAEMSATDNQTIGDVRTPVLGRNRPPHTGPDRRYVQPRPQFAGQAAPQPAPTTPAPAPSPGYQPGLGAQHWRQAWAELLPQFTGALRRMAAGGELGATGPGNPTNAGGGPGALQYYGTDTQGSNITIRNYTPEQLGNQTFIQKLYKGAPQVPFQGFGGGGISNPAIGINNLPSIYNLQRFAQLDPVEQDLQQSLLEQGLGLDARATFQSSKAAAPVGAYMGGARYRGSLV